MKAKRCVIARETCPVHGVVHGREAEELRAGVETILQDDEGLGHVEDVFDRLRSLLDNVDARDSLAFRESESLPRCLASHRGGRCLYRTGHSGRHWKQLADGSMRSFGRTQGERAMGEGAHLSSDPNQ